MKVLLTLYLMLNTLDLALTAWGLSAGAVELNPIPIVWKAGSLFVVALGCLYVSRANRRLARVLLAGLCLFYAGLVAWNLGVVFALV